MWSVGALPGKGLLERVVFKEKTLKHQQKNTCVRRCDPPKHEGPRPQLFGEFDVSGAADSQGEPLGVGPEGKPPSSVSGDRKVREWGHGGEAQRG